MAATRLGPKTMFDYTKEDTFFSWMDGYDTGIMQFSFGNIPLECEEFCLEQYARFGIPFPEEIREALMVGASYAFQYLDLVAPYELFNGICDVDITSDWAEHAYELLGAYKDRPMELSPEQLETFIFVPGQAEKTFEHIMSHPGLLALPNRVGHEILEQMEEAMYMGEPYHQLVDKGCLDTLRAMCTEAGGVVNWTRIRAYFELAAWAAFGWIVGPLGRNHRMQVHDVMMVAIQYGEAIVYEGGIYGPQDYTKLPRPPQSCYICGLAAWCVELTSSYEGTRHICEHCLSEGMPPSTVATCGAKRCMLTACRHHPYHHLGAGGIGRAYREHGQLGAAARKIQTQQLIGASL